MSFQQAGTSGTRFCRYFYFSNSLGWRISTFSSYVRSTTSYPFQMPPTPFKCLLETLRFFTVQICILQSIVSISITNGIPTSFIPLSFVIFFDGVVTVSEVLPRHVVKYSLLPPSRPFPCIRYVRTTCDNARTSVRTRDSWRLSAVAGCRRSHGEILSLVTWSRWDNVQSERGMPPNLST
jgi:hypothetical protein